MAHVRNFTTAMSRPKQRAMADTMSALDCILPFVFDSVMRSSA